MNLEQAMGKLPPRVAQVFQLYEVEDRPNAEVCARLNISESNLWVMLHRARKQLRGHLTGWWNGNSNPQRPTTLKHGLATLIISRSAPVDHAVILRLEGRVIGPWVTELKQSCEDVLTEGRLLKLHLADVEFMDAQGVGLLSNLLSRGVSLLDCPPFAAAQLKLASKL